VVSFDLAHPVQTSEKDKGQVSLAVSLLYYLLAGQSKIGFKLCLELALNSVLSLFVKLKSI